MNTDVSDEILSAYIDDELDPADRAVLLDRFTADSRLRSRACELWQLKQMVRGAYPLPLKASRSAASCPRGMPAWAQALAASLLLIIGTTSGWLMHARADTENLMTGQIESIRADGGRVVLHLFSDEPERMEATLRLAEQLANTQDRAGRPFRVELLANGPGLHLLRDGGSPYAAKVAALRNHDNLRLVACREAMARLRDRGIDVTLLPGVEEAQSAENELAAKLTQGWRYIQT
jgi:intracellular sulfur oxidation DsrE/DsrF family protein